MTNAFFLQSSDADGKNTFQATLQLHLPHISEPQQGLTHIFKVITFSVLSSDAFNASHLLCHSRFAKASVDLTQAPGLLFLY